MEKIIDKDEMVLNIINMVSTITEDNQIINDIKQILYMNFTGLQIYKEETSLSLDVDCTFDYLEKYIINMKMNGCTKGSINSYKTDLKNMLNFVNKDIRDITYDDLRNYLAHGRFVRNWKDRTYNTKIVQIRGLFNWLYTEDLIKDNPAKKLKESKVEHKIGVILKPEQREELRCSCLNEKELALCDLLYSSGARISEICALNISDIDFINMTAIVYGKGRKEREIYFNAPTKVHLQKYLESRTDKSEALFVNDNAPHARMSQNSVRNMLKKIKNRNEDISDVALTPHVFRRTVGTEMINRGAPLEIVAEKLGHSKLDTTKQCYASISKETVHQAHNRYVS